MAMPRIYLDNNATTPLDPLVRQAMLPFLDEWFGNPSSNHRLGQLNREAVEQARVEVAALVKAPSSRIIFTSGGTESNNAAIWGAVLACPEKRHILASTVEHASVRKPLEFLKGRGYEVELLPIDRAGGLDLERLKGLLRPDTLLISLLGANNETGVLWPVAEIGRIARERGVPFHCDMVQMLGKMEVDLTATPVDFASFSAHKIHGPKGCGALYVRRGAPFVPFIMGGGQERNLRAGTENVAGIVGFGRAAVLAGERLTEFQDRMAELRDFLEHAIIEKIPGALVNGRELPRLPNTLNVSFMNASAEAIIQELDERGFSVAAQSACHSHDVSPSPVLSAMGVPEVYLHGSMRISLALQNTKEEVAAFLAVLPGLVERSRANCLA